MTYSASIASEQTSMLRCLVRSSMRALDFLIASSLSRIARRIISSTRSNSRILRFTYTYRPHLSALVHTHYSSAYMHRQTHTASRWASQWLSQSLSTVIGTMTEHGHHSHTGRADYHDERKIKNMRKTKSIIRISITWVQQVSTQCNTDTETITVQLCTRGTV